MAFEEAGSEVLKESWENFIGNWRKSDPCYIVAEILATLFPVVTEVVNVFNELSDLAKEITEQCRCHLASPRYFRENVRGDR